MSEEYEPGDFVPEVPPRANGSSRVDLYGLDAMAIKARERPGVPMLAGKDIPYRYTNSLRVRNRDPYITAEGRIKVSIKTVKEVPENPADRVVDTYFTWEPFPNT